MSADNYQSVDENDSLSMVDVLAEQSRMQEDASAVLGDSDEHNCTYPNGYIQRQALYACATCTGSELAGICLACSYHCHEGHELYELYTKRNFRCDCGNSKFGAYTCKLVPKKDHVNSDNCYNQNFRGSYCICARPYPDPDDEAEDEMIQCIVCEDWYHGRHLNTVLPDNEDYQEMICTTCMGKHSFLWAYQVNINAVFTKKGITVEDESAQVKTCEEEKDNEHAKAENMKPKNEIKAELVVPSEASSATSNGISTISEPSQKRLKIEAANGESIRNNKTEEQCLLRDLQPRDSKAKECAAFWSSGWRERLCKCGHCLSLYKKKDLEFLMDVGDTVHAYEERGRSKAPELSESELEQSALSQMNHVQKIEVVQGFMDMKAELREYLKGFADSGKVVCADDIRAFFARMEERKKERLASLQYQCK